MQPDLARHCGAFEWSTCDSAKHHRDRGHRVGARLSGLVLDIDALWRELEQAVAESR